MAQLSPAAHAAQAQEGETKVAFHLSQPVSLANGHTLSLPIIDETASVSRVAIYDPQVGRPPSPKRGRTRQRRRDRAAAGHRHDLRGAARTAPTYVGDSRLSATPAGEKRLLSYALDQKTTIAEDNSDNSSLVRARIAKGVLTLDDLTRRRALFRVNAAEPRSSWSSRRSSKEASSPSPYSPA